MVDLSSEKNLGRDHGVLVWQEKLAVEDATFVWRLGWSCDFDVEVSGVALVWLSVNANNWILGKSLSFLHRQRFLCEFVESYLP